MKKFSARGVAIRPHQFPPLRKSWPQPEGQPAVMEAAEYQQQLVAGFNQGLSDGFTQGVETGKTQGYQEGKLQGQQEGMRLGQEEGKRQALSTFNQAAQPLNVIAEKLQRALDTHKQHRRSELLQLVEKVTRQVIRCELALQPAQLLALVEEALASLSEPPKRLRVLLNPEEFARISEIDAEKVSRWGLVADDEMPLGECRIVTESAEMDVGCAHRLEQCMDVLTENLSVQPEAQ